MVWPSVAVDSNSMRQIYLSIRIAGKWTIPDFIRILTSIDNIYGMALPESDYYSKEDRNEVLAAVKKSNKLLDLPAPYKVEELNRFIDFDFKNQYSLRRQRGYVVKEEIFNQRRIDERRHLADDASSEKQVVKPPITFIDIKEIKYASPGKIDVTGVGSAIEAIFNWVKYFNPNKLEKELLELNIEEKKISIASAEQTLFSQMLNNWHAAGFTKAQIKDLSANFIKNTSAIQLQIVDEPENGAFITDILFVDEDGNKKSLNDPPILE